MKNFSTIILLVIVLFILIFGFSTKIYNEYFQTENIYEEMTPIQSVDYQPKEEKYFVYYYYEDCKFCAMIKDETKAFNDLITKTENVNFYIADIKNEDVINHMKQSEKMVYGTPTLEYYQNNKLEATYVGAADVPEAYNKYTDELKK